MKFIYPWLLGLAVSSFLPLCAQETPAQTEWKRQQAESIDLATKLFPDLNKEGSPLLKEFARILPNAKAYPQLAQDSHQALFFATQAAKDLGISPKWDALKDQEKLLAFQELVNYAKLIGTVVASQNRYIAQLRTQPAQVSSATTSFDPDALTNPEAWKTFHPSAAPSYTAVQDGGGNFIISPSQ